MEDVVALGAGEHEHVVAAFHIEKPRAGDPDSVNDELKKVKSYSAALRVVSGVCPVVARM